MRDSEPPEPGLLGARIVVIGSMLSETGDRSELLAIVRRHKCEQWLSFLSRAQTLIMDPHTTNPQRQVEFMQMLVSTRIQRKLTELVRSDPNGDRFLFVTPDILGILQELVVLYAPLDGSRPFENEDDFDDFGRAVLIVAETLHGGRIAPSLGEVVFEVAQQSDRVQRDPIWQLVSRALWQFELESDCPSAEAAWFRDEFLKATGVELCRYFLGGLIVLIREMVKSSDQLYRAWIGVHAHHASEKESSLVEDYLSVRAASIETLRITVQETEKVDNALRNWTLIPLQKYPIIRFSDGGCYVLHPGAVVNSLLDGFYFAILDSYRRLSDIKQRQGCIELLGSKFGLLVENYVCAVLRDTFGDRLLKLPPSPEKNRRRCDFAVIYPNKVILIEIKTSRFTAARYECQEPSDLQERLRKIDLPGAVQQLVHTIEDLRAFRIAEPQLKNIDWTTTAIIPLVLNEENLPAVPFAWNQYYIQYDSELQRLKTGAGTIGHLRFLSPEDLFYVSEITKGDEFARELLCWGNDTDHISSSFRNYLISKGYSLRCLDGKEIFKRAGNLLARSLELNDVWLGSEDNSKQE